MACIFPVPKICVRQKPFFPFRNFFFELCTFSTQIKGGKKEWNHFLKRFPLSDKAKPFCSKELNFRTQNPRFNYVSVLNCLCWKTYFIIKFRPANKQFPLHLWCFSDGSKWYRVRLKGDETGSYVPQRGKGCRWQLSRMGPVINELACMLTHIAANVSTFSSLTL